MTALLETQRISAAPAWKIDVLAPAEVRATARWRRTFSDKHKDFRYYELIEDTLHQGFDYRYIAIEDRSGAVRAIQPFFLVDQSVLAGLPALDRAAGSIR